MTNIQGDIIGLIDGSGTSVVQYTYDAWGNQTSCTGTLANTLGQANPYRYRGYRFDTETGLYYLQSRYFDANVGRFVNADDLAIITGNNHNQINLFEYCINNPIMFNDPSGFWVFAISFVGQACAVIGGYAGFTFAIDKNLNYSILFVRGFLVQTNLSAGVCAYLSLYTAMETIDDLEGWSATISLQVSLGAIFTIKTGGIVSVNICFNGKTFVPVSWSIGAGVSFINNIPYFEVAVGYSGILKKGNLIDDAKKVLYRRYSYSYYGVTYYGTNYGTYYLIDLPLLKQRIKYIYSTKRFITSSYY